MQQVSGQDGPQGGPIRGRGARPTQAPMIPNTIEGLWILLVPNEGELPTSDPEGRVPMMARAGDDQTYLLAFKNVARAREFLTACEMSADPRMVVRGNKVDILRIAQAARVVGVLVDYDPTTQAYTAAIELA
jgi:hypothetical protein